MTALKVKVDGNWVTLPGADGPQGPEGPAGSTGPAGPGVPPGGTAKQVLTKSGPADYATTWASIADISVGPVEPPTPAINTVWIDTSP